MREIFASGSAGGRWAALVSLPALADALDGNGRSASIKFQFRPSLGWLLSIFVRKGETL